MEKHQILRPKRVNATPFLKFYRKVFALIAGASFATWGFLELEKGERVVKVWRSGIHEDSAKNNLIRLRMSSPVSIRTFADIDDVELHYMNEQRNEAMKFSAKPEHCVGEDLY